MNDSIKSYVTEAIETHKKMVWENALYLNRTIEYDYERKI